jgi:hypothetical protein
MEVINDFAGLQSAPPPDAAESTKDTNVRLALYRPGVLGQPALQKLSVRNTPPALSNAGTPTGVASLPNVTPFAVPQGQGGASGTSTLADIMSHLGKPMTPNDIDRAIRRTPIDLAFAPEDMIQFARQNGLTAEGYNNGSWDEVKSMVDAGRPVQAMLNDGNYMYITGHGTDPATGQEYVTYLDPNLETEQRMPVSDFEKKWGPANDGLIHADGFNHYFIAYGDAHADLPRGRDEGIEGEQSYKNGAANLANGLDRIVHPDSWGGFVHGTLQATTSIPQVLGGYVAAGLQTGARWLNDEVAGIPVLRNVVQPIGDLVSGVGAGMADVFNSVGEFGDDIGGAFEDLSHGDGGKFVHRLGDAAKDIGGGLADAARDTVGAVEGAVKDFFSGW